MQNKIIVILNDKEKEVKKIKGLKIQFSGTGNIVKIEQPCPFKNSFITIDGNNNSVYFGSSGVGFNQLFVYIAQGGNNKELRFGRDCSCISLVIYLHEHNSKIIIGNNCMFAGNTCIQATDSHSIIDCATNKLLNLGNEVILGNNVWVAQDATILKNVHIPDNVVVQTKALVVKDVPESNCVVGGIPAKVIKQGIRWTRWAPNHIPQSDIDSEITFVVQGAVDKFWTRRCLESIRVHFPLSKILLSTWENSDLSQISGLYDEVLLNKDPGAAPFSQDKDFSASFNLDRQIISSKNGLKAVKTKYAIKIRTDMIIKNRDFLNYFDKLSDFDDKYKLFKKRIVSFAAYNTRTPDGKKAWDFCMHDYGYFGLTKDLLLLWDIPTTTEKEKYYWKDKKYPNLNSEYASFIEDYIKIKPYHQYHAEQYILLKCFAKLKGVKIKLKNMFDFNNDNTELFQRIVVNNFVPLYSNRMGVSLPRDAIEYNTPYMSNLDYTYTEFLQLYNKYANGNIVIPDKDSEREKWKNIVVRDKKTRLYKLLHFYWLRGKK